MKRNISMVAFAVMVIPAILFVSCHVDSPLREYPYVNQIVVRDNHAYIAYGDSGMVVLDISDPCNPVAVLENDSYDYAYAIGSIDNTFYLIFNGGIEIFGLDNAEQPTLAEYYSLEDTVGPRGMSRFIENDRLVAPYGEFMIYDVADRMNPSLTGTCHLPGTAQDVYVNGSVCYITDFEYGLLTVDMTNAFNPNVIDTIPMEWANDLTVIDQHLYVSSAFNTLYVFDISVPSSPVLMNSIEYPFRIGCISFGGNSLFIAENYPADMSTRLNVCDISDPLAPTTTGRSEMRGGGVARCITFKNDTVFLGGTVGLLIIDVADPSTPVVSGLYKTDKFTRHESYD